MKKSLLLLLLLFFSFVCSSAAQDLQATKQYLETQLEILSLQETLSALQGQTDTGSSAGNSDNGMWNWGSQNSPLYSTPTPFNNSGYNSGNAVTLRNFPSMVRPPVPSGPPPVWQIPYNRYFTEIYVGDAGQYRTISEAMKNIPDNAGEVTIYLVSNTEEPQSGISIPIGKKVTSVRIVSSDEKTLRSVWPADRSIWFFCNGIPLVIDRTVAFEKMSMIMGGFVTYSGHNVEAPQSTIIVNGKAYWVYAGGQSDREGHSSTVQNALVIVNGEVDRVYAGGRAIWGETIVHNAVVVVNGTAKEVYCSGYTENAAAKTTVGRADMRIYGWYSTYGLGLGSGEVTLLDPRGCY
ncbi:MAG: hypothetical protein IJI14_17070 [Anaerolineaceae bacterium]|nr:hypothetical protein [Anaerolineaceae bacterium]